MHKISNFGILTSVSWNSNNWKSDLTKSDIENSQYDYVKKEKHAHESLNFGHKKYPLEKDNRYIAYTPIFNNRPSEKNSKNVNVVFFLSTDYNDNKKKKIIGCYGFPEIGDFKRKSKHKKFRTYDFGNIRSNVEDIVYLKHHVEITNELSKKLELLPTGRKISQQGFNYLHSTNVYKLLKLISKTNENNKELSLLSKRLRKIQVTCSTEIDDTQQVNSVIQGITAHNLSDISELEERMKGKKPTVKERVSKYIERGTIAKKVKKITKYKCLICKKLGVDPHCFTKKNGELYIEAHHVEPVSNLKKGSLSISNLITVCPNHHRQLHYGDCKVVENTNNYFMFQIDDERIKIKKVTLGS